MTQAVQTPTRPGMPALRPLTGLIGRSGEMGRLLGHIDARRSVRLCAPRGAGTTALLRALCAEPARPGTADGTIALPAGLPVADLITLTPRILGQSGPLEHRHMLVLLDNRAASAADLAALREQLASSVLVVTADEPGSDESGAPASTAGALTPVVLPGLSEHHAVGLIEAAVGRPLSIDEGRAARFVATAVHGRPVWLVQAAAGVRDAGLTFTDIRELLGDPPRPVALTVALQLALDDDLHTVLTHLRTFGEVPTPTPVVAAASACDIEDAARRMRRLSLLGLASTDGRDGWTAAVGVPGVAEPVRSAAADRVADWMAAQDADALDVFTVASTLTLVADRMASDDPATTGRLASTALDRLPLEDLPHARERLEEALAWAAPPAARVDTVVAAPTPDAAPAGDDADVDSPADSVADAAQAAAAPADGSPAVTDPADGNLALDPAALDQSAHDQSAHDDAARDDAASGGPQGAASEQPHDSGAVDLPAEKAAPWLSSLLSDWRRLAIVAVAAAAVIAGVLLAVPMLRPDASPALVRADVDLGVASIGDSASGTLALNLAERSAVTPVDLVLSGPDADAFTVDPARCDGLDCRSSVGFTADRSGTHLATVTAVDAQGVEHAVVELTASGTGDPPDRPVLTNLAVTLFPAEPSPVPAGGTAVLPVGVRNNGPADSTGARLTVVVPAGVSASAAGCAFEGVELTCPLAELPAGGQERVAVTVTLPAEASDLRLSATVEPLTGTDEAPADNAAGFTYPVAAPAAESPPDPAA